MSTLPRASSNPAHEYFIPTAAWVQSLKVGDLAPDCFGRLVEVVEIVYRGVNVAGAAYVGVRLQFGFKGAMSQSYAAGRLHTIVSNSHNHTAHELKQIEAQHAQYVERLHTQAESLVTALGLKWRDADTREQKHRIVRVYRRAFARMTKRQDTYNTKASNA